MSRPIVNGEVDGDHIVPNPMKQKGRLRKRGEWCVLFRIREELVANRHFPAGSVVEDWYFAVSFPVRQLLGAHLGYPTFIEVEGRRKENQPNDLRMPAGQQS